MRQGHTQRGHHESAAQARGHPQHHDHDGHGVAKPSGCYLRAQEFEARVRRNEPGMPLDEEPPPRAKRSRQ